MVIIFFYGYGKIVNGLVKIVKSSGCVDGWMGGWNYVLKQGGGG
jgi:hypothetical protein